MNNSALTAVPPEAVEHEGNVLLLLHDGEAAFPSMLQAIANAQQQVLLEMYWFASDQVGWTFANALCERASAGVEVAVLVDAFGSLGTDAVLYETLERAGAQVCLYHPLRQFYRPRALWQLGRRNHRKTLVVDGRIGFVGGINLTNAWLSQREGGGGWRDEAVRLEGPAVRPLVACFAHAWATQGGGPLRLDTWPTPSMPSPSEVITAHREKYSVLAIGEGGLFERYRLTHAYLDTIWAARQRIWIANSYFVPDRAIRSALCRAAGRGVDVRIMIPATGDVGIIHYAIRAALPRLLRYGVKVYEWQGPMLHSKTAVIDSHWSTIGSFNLDHRSIKGNLEANVMVRNRAFAATLEETFEHDLAQCTPLTLEKLRRRPWWRKLLARLCYSIRHFL